MKIQTINMRIRQLTEEVTRLQTLVNKLSAQVGTTTEREHEPGCPGIYAWDIPGACTCDYPKVTRCCGCGKQLKREEKTI